ncbi:MAG: DUF4296 domain-containing protein, partial [Tannerella sp.]|nr:DUF4296 domain-containing protein [Tannerella sp.]
MRNRIYMPDMLRRLFLKAGTVLFLLTFFVSCSKVPKGIIPEKKMTEMLIDMQLAESIISTD